MIDVRYLNILTVRK